MGRHYLRILAAATRDPRLPVGEIDLMDREERRTLLAGGISGSTESGQARTRQGATENRIGHIRPRSNTVQASPPERSGTLATNCQRRTTPSRLQRS